MHGVDCHVDWFCVGWMLLDYFVVGLVCVREPTSLQMNDVRFVTLNGER